MFGVKSKKYKKKLILRINHLLITFFITFLAITINTSRLLAGERVKSTGSPAIAEDSNQVSGSIIPGIDEKLGNYVPLDLPFVTETGNAIQLRNVIKAPTVLSIVYYKCPNACDYLLTGISSALRSYTDRPGSEPNLITLTIDERETPADAMKAKNIAFEAIEKPYPSNKWHFLTGSRESIKKLTDAVGFRFVRNGDDFDHPIGLIILSPQGKVVRYIMGTDFLPVDLTMSLMEASTGTVSPTIARVLRFCFSYNPKSHQFVFNTLRVSAIVIFVLVGSFVIYLVLSGRKRRLKGGS